MNIGAWLTLTGISALVAACSGTTTLGNGVGGSGGSMVGSGGSSGAGVGTGGMSESGGGISSPCAGRACGASCSTCAPDNMNCRGVQMYCAEDGSCGINYPVCSGVGGVCTVDDDCATDLS